MRCRAGPDDRLFARIAAAALLLRVKVPAREPRPVTSPESSRTCAKAGSSSTPRHGFFIVVLSFSVLNTLQARAIFILGPTVAKETIGEAGWGLVSRQRRSDSS